MFLLGFDVSCCHLGTWVNGNAEAQVFDKKYYHALMHDSWRPRNFQSDNEDWTTGDNDSRVMLNTDVSTRCALLINVTSTLDSYSTCILLLAVSGI